MTTNRGNLTKKLETVGWGLVLILLGAAVLAIFRWALGSSASA